MYTLLKKIYYFFVSLRNLVFSGRLNASQIKQIPIVINNRNHLTYLKALLLTLESSGYLNIYILDNASSYGPLLEFYRANESRYKILYLPNLGYNALEKIPLYKDLRKSYYVYTDADVVPASQCPKDFLEHFYHILRKWPLLQKAGFSLRIDDLPDYYKQKEKVIAWESQFYETELAPGLFKANIDTTFALHRPYSYISKKGIFKMVRTAAPYTASHMPWYQDSDNLSKEQEFYINSVEIGTHWSKGIPIAGTTFLHRIFISVKNMFKKPVSSK